MEEFWRFLARGLPGLKVEIPEVVPEPPLTWNQYLARGVPGVPDRVPSSSSSSSIPLVAEITAEEELPEPPQPEVTVVATDPSQQRSGSGIFATTGHPKPSAPPPTRSTVVVPPPAPPSSSSSSSRPLGGNARVVVLWSSISTDSTTARMEDMFAAKKLVTDKVYSLLTKE